MDWLELHFWLGLGGAGLAFVVLLTGLRPTYTPTEALPAGRAATEYTPSILVYTGWRTPSVRSSSSTGSGGYSYGK